jgi:hypothetical protein
MNNRFSQLTTGLTIFAAIALSTSNASAVFYPLGPSKDDWGMKYDVQLSAAGAQHVNVVFKLTNEGRLKPIHSFTLVALRQVSPGTYAYDAKLPIELKTNADGSRVGQVQIRRELLDKAMIRVLTFSVDGKRQTSGAALYNLPLNKFMNQLAPATLAAPPATSSVK